MLDDKDWLVRAAAVQAVGALGVRWVTDTHRSRIPGTPGLLDDANEPVGKQPVRWALGDAVGD